MKNILQKLARLLPDSIVISRYKRAGCIFGDIESYCFMGEAGGYDWHLWWWSFWEEEIIRRGYRSISLDEFILVGGGYKDNFHPIVLRGEDEQPIYHSIIRNEQVVRGSDEGLVDLTVYPDGSFEGKYVLPSTVHESKGSSGF